jgi:hypothetical protein
MESGRRTEGDFHPLGWAVGQDLSGREDKFVTANAGILAKNRRPLLNKFVISTGA